LREHEESEEEPIKVFMRDRSVKKLRGRRGILEDTYSFETGQGKVNRLKMKAK